MLDGMSCADISANAAESTLTRVTRKLAAASAVAITVELLQVLLQMLTAV